MSVTLRIVDLWQYYVQYVYKIGCNPMHPLYGALPRPYVPACVTHGALVSHRYTHAPPRCRTSQKRRTFISLLSLWNDHGDSVFNGVGLAFLDQSRCILIRLAARSLFVFYSFPFFGFLSIYVGIMWPSD